MTRLSAHALEVTLPPGWDGSIYRRPPAPGEQSFPVMHVSSFPLPHPRGDFGAGAVEGMGPEDVFISLFEYGPASLDKPLFERRGIDLPLVPSYFHPKALQRLIRGQAGYQQFFQQVARTFCLYVVIGSTAYARHLVDRASTVVSTLAIGSTS